MSTKKDKFSTKDKNYMRLALILASSRKGLTGENPSVGCVIVKNDEIISVGQTGYNGRPHAEINAIKNSTESLKDSKMYVSLEPCNHYGKSPPCTDSIVKYGIKEVHFAINDIDKRVKGKTQKILFKNKIKVRVGLLKKEAINFYKSYNINRINKLPYVTGKIATSRNNMIYKKGYKRITNNISDKLTHYLRYKNDAIMISGRTVNFDNPRLDCRLRGYEKFSPKRIILDKDLEIKVNSYIFKTVKKGNTILFHDSANKFKLKILEKKGVLLIKSKLTNKKIFNLRIVLKTLYKQGIRNLLVEGGDKITKSFLDNRLINEFYLFKSPKILTKNQNYLNFTSHGILDRKYKKKFNSSIKLGTDNITIYKR